MPRWRLPMCWKGSGDAGDVIRIMLWSLTGRQMLPGFLRPRTFRRAGAYTGIRAVLRPNPRKGVDDMLRSLQWAALGTGFTFLMTTLGAAMVFFFAGEPKPRFQRAMLGFAAGVMTAASVWSLLLPAIDQAAEDGRLPGWLPAAAGMLLGVMFLAALDALLPHLRRGREQTDAAWRQNTLLMTAITLHNVPEGMAVGLAFALAAGGENFAGAAALALGIGIQNFPEGAAIALPLRQEGRPRGRAFLGGEFEDKDYGFSNG